MANVAEKAIERRYVRIGEYRGRWLWSAFADTDEQIAYAAHALRHSGMIYGYVRDVGRDSIVRCVMGMPMAPLPEPPPYWEIGL